MPRRSGRAVQLRPARGRRGMGTADQSGTGKAARRDGRVCSPQARSVRSGRAERAGQRVRGGRDRRPVATDPPRGRHQARTRPRSCRSAPHNASGSPRRPHQPGQGTRDGGAHRRPCRRTCPKRGRGTSPAPGGLTDRVGDAARPAPRCRCRRSGRHSEATHESQGRALPRHAPLARRHGRDQRRSAGRRRHGRVHAADALARSADPRDPRGVGARRADALVDMCRAVLAGGATTPRADPEPGPADEPTTAKAANRSMRRRLVRRQRRRGPHIQVTVAATTLLGVDDQPGELAGYGSIPADVARRIAHDSDATWRRLLTDPRSGVLLDYGTTVYRPPPALDRHVVARDQVCAFPGCRQPAIACDLDHRVPYPHGPTSEGNLGPLCRHHHRARHEAGWGWHRSADGSVTWTAPTGHQYPAPTPPVLGAASF